MTIKENQLESNQSYHARGVHGFGKRQQEPEPEPETFICGLCCEAIVKDEGDYCPECAAEDAEYRSDQEMDR